MIGLPLHEERGINAPLGVSSGLPGKGGDVESASELESTPLSGGEGAEALQEAGAKELLEQRGALATFAAESLGGGAGGDAGGCSDGSTDRQGTLRWMQLQACRQGANTTSAGRLSDQYLLGAGPGGVPDRIAGFTAEMPGLLRLSQAEREMKGTQRGPVGAAASAAAVVGRRSGTAPVSKGSSARSHRAMCVL